MPPLTMIRNDAHVLGDDISTLSRLDPTTSVTKERALQWWSDRVTVGTQRQDKFAMTGATIVSLIIWLFVGLSLSGPSLFILFGCLLGFAVTAVALSALASVAVEGSSFLQRSAARRAITTTLPLALFQTSVETNTTTITLRLVSCDEGVLGALDVPVQVKPGARVPEMTLLKKTYALHDEVDAHEDLLVWESFCRSFNEQATEACTQQYSLPSTVEDAVAFQRALQNVTSFEAHQAKLERKARKKQLALPDGAESDRLAAQARLESTQQDSDKPAL